MDKHYDKTEIFAWMPMIGFDRDQPDKGVGAFLERTQYVPHGTSVFMFHPDIVHIQPPQLVTCQGFQAEQGGYGKFKLIHIAS